MKPDDRRLYPEKLDPLSTLDILKSKSPPVLLSLCTVCGGALGAGLVDEKYVTAMGGAEGGSCDVCENVFSPSARLLLPRFPDTIKKESSTSSASFCFTRRRSLHRNHSIAPNSPPIVLTQTKTIAIMAALLGGFNNDCTWQIFHNSLRKRCFCRALPKVTGAVAVASAIICVHLSCLVRGREFG